MAISLKVNGATRSVNAEPDTPLLYVLRNDLELNGAKFGCGLSQCGACTVLVDGKAMRSCVTPISKVGKAEVTTLEGLGTPAKLHPLQQAFIDEQAAQCGYCTSGMIMAAKELLDRNPRPTEAEVREGLDRQSVPLRQPQPHRPRRPARRPGEREDLIMNAPHLTRRDFTAGLGGIVLAFSMGRRPRSAQEHAAAARQPQQQPHARCVAAHQRRRHRDRVSPARSSWGRASSPRLSQIAAEELDLPLARVTIDLRRHRTHAERRPDQRQPVDREQRHGAAACRRGGARDPARARRQEVSASRRTALQGHRRRHHARRTAARSPTASLPAQVDLKREATGKVRAEAAGAAQDRRPVDRRASTFRPRSPAARRSCRTCALPGMVHGRVVRPPRYGARLESVDESKARAMPGVVAVVRDGSFLGVVAEREEQAIKAARSRWPQAPNGRRAGNCPIRRSCYEQMMAMPTHGHRSSARRRRRCRRGAKVVEATYTGRSRRMPRSVRPARSREFKDGQYTVWTHSQGVFPLRERSAKALKVKPQRDPLHPRRRRRLLRPQRRRRRAASMRRCWRARCRAGRCACNGCATTSSSGSRTAPPWRCRPAARSHDGRDRRLALRRLEPARTTCVRQAGRHQPVAELVSGRCRSRPGRRAQATRAELRGRPQRDAALRLPEPAHRPALHPGDAAAHVGAAHARRLLQRVRGRVLHGRAGGGGGRRSGRVPAGAHEGSARARRDRGGRQGWRTGSPARRATARAAAASASPATRTWRPTAPCVAEVEVDRASGKITGAARLDARSMPG